MSYISLQDLLGKSKGSAYKLVVMASRRALEISEGQPKLVKVDASMKASTVALEEISLGKVKLKK
jgi:DNA-directed RNA polymerase omega subunit